MKQYVRRDFLKALGIGAAGAVVAPELVAQNQQQEILIPAGARIIPQPINQEPWSFPWELHGQAEIPSGFPGVQIARVIALEAEPPPDGYSFYIRSLRFKISPETKLLDWIRFLDSWRVIIDFGSTGFVPIPSRRFVAGIGLISIPPALAIGGTGEGLPIFPELPVLPGAPLKILFEGEPFERASSSMIVGASVHGVGVNLHKPDLGLRLGSLEPGCFIPAAFSLPAQPWHDQPESIREPGTANAESTSHIFTPEATNAS